MQLRKQGGAVPRMLSSLAGFHLGIIGGVLTLAWFCVSALWQHYPWWGWFNLFGSTFYGEAALDRGLGFVSLSGVALHIVVSGMVGLLFGAAMRESGNDLRAALAGLAVGLGTYYFLYGFLWKRWSPLIPAYSSSRLAFFAYLIFGIVLGQQPRLLRRISGQGGAGAPPPPAPDTGTSQGPAAGF